MITDQQTNDPMDGPDRGIALNRAIWLLSEAMGMVPSGTRKIDVEISSVIKAACDKIRIAAIEPTAVAAPSDAEPLHITHGPLMRHAAYLLRSRKLVLPEDERVADELERAVDGYPTPSGEPSPEWIKVARIAAASQREQNMAALIRRMARPLKHVDPTLANRAIEALRRWGLQGSPLREDGASKGDA